MSPPSAATRQSLTPDTFAAELPADKGGVWWVGFSGGLDSSVLLHLLSQVCGTPGSPELRAVHVNHQLSPGARQWQQHCEAVCAELAIPVHVESVSVAPTGSGLEAAARDARYEVFTGLVEPGDTLFLAHHRDDQVETFFLRLMRGAGTRGLMAMPKTRALGEARLWRPLLEWDREQLQICAQQQGLRWIEDDSNCDTRLDRNYLRREVMPLLEARWPGYRDSVLHARQAVQESEALLDQYLGPQLEAALGSCFGEPTLSLDSLQQLDSQGACRLLRLWLLRLQLQSPGRAALREFVRQLQQSGRPGHCILSGNTYSLRHFDGAVHAVADPGAIVPPAAALLPGQTMGLGESRLEAQGSAAGGLRNPAPGHWKVVYRSGGERARPQGRPHSQSLKKLLQACGVPPWWRDRLPLLYEKDELVAVADLWVCEGYAAGAGQPGWKVRWHRHSLALVD